MHKSPILMCCLGLQHTSDHLQSCIPQAFHASTSYTRIGILHSYHYPANTGSQYSFSARRCLTLMTAGFQGDYQGSTFGLLTSLCQSTYLRMRLTSTSVKALSRQGS
jgi:hypothetical protein